MYVYMYVCMYVCMYVHVSIIYIYIYHIYIRLYVHMFTLGFKAIRVSRGSGGKLEYSDILLLEDFEADSSRLYRV